MARIQVLDENDRPVFCDVAAISSSTGATLQVVSTDTSGIAVLTASGDWFPHPLVSRDYKSRLKVSQVPGAQGGGADCMFDYLVSSCFTSLTGFVEGTSYTTISGCTFKGYSTTQGAWNAAAAVVGNFTIALCSGPQSPLLTTNALDVLGGGKISIIGFGTASLKGTLAQPIAWEDTTTAGAAHNPVWTNVLFSGYSSADYAVSKTTDYGYALNAYDCEFTTPVRFRGSGFNCHDSTFSSGATGPTLFSCDGKDSSFNAWFYSCIFNGTVRPTSETYFQNCTSNFGAAIGIDASNSSSSLYVTGHVFRSTGTAYTYYFKVGAFSNVRIRNCYANVGATAAILVTAAYNYNGGYMHVVGNAWGCVLGMDIQSGSVTNLLYQGNSGPVHAFDPTPTIVQTSGAGNCDDSVFGPNGHSNAKYNITGSRNLFFPGSSAIGTSTGSGINARYNLYETSGFVDSWLEGALITPSAGALTLGTDGDVFHVAAGNFSSIAVPTRQTVVILVFDGVSVLTNGANLILQGATNFTSAAGDVLVLFYDGASVWREINRHTAAAASAGGHAIHDEVAAALTTRADLHFQGKGIFAQDNGASTRTEVIAGAYYDAIVDSNDTNAAGKGNVYSTLQAAITAGHYSIFVRACTDAVDITITAENVNRITGADVQTTSIPVNVICNKTNVLFEQLQFNTKSLTFGASGCIAFACLFMGSITAGTALINSAAIGAATTSIPWDGPLNGGLATRGYGKVNNEVFGWNSGGGAGASGTLSCTGGVRGMLETLGEAQADNATITDMNNGNMIINAADCELTACAFIACTNANLPALWIKVGGLRAKVTACRFLANTTWSCIGIAWDTTAVSGPTGIQIVGNKFDSNTTFSHLIEAFGKDSGPAADDLRLLSANGNLFRTMHAGCFRGMFGLANIAGNTFDGVTKNTLAYKVNNAANIGAADTTIDYDTASGSGTLASKGMLLIDTEEIYYSAKSATQFLGCRRGQNGTTAAIHLDNADIFNLSQRAFTFLASSSSGLGLVGNAVSGNTIDSLTLVSHTTRTGGSTGFALTVFSTNAVSRCTRWYGEQGSCFIGNLIKLNSSAIFDFRSGTGQVFVGNLAPVTFSNIPTDLRFLFSAASIGSAGVLTREVLPAGQNSQFGFTRGDSSAMTVPMKNKSGANSVAKSVVIADVANANSFTRSVLVGGNDPLVCGVCMTGGIADGSDADIAICGVVVVTCTGTVNIGDMIVTDVAAGVAKTNNAYAKGTRVGIAKTAGVFGAGTGDITIQVWPA